MSEAARVELGNDIKTNGGIPRERVKVLSILKGARTPFALSEAAVWDPKYRNFEVLDGRSRLDAMESVGLEVAIFDKDGLLNSELFEIVDLARGDTPEAYVASANVHRRHLSAEDRQDALIRLIARAPEKGDRLIGEEAGVDHKVVGRARKKGEQLGRVPQLAKTIGKDGKARKAPVRKTLAPKSAPKAAPPPAGALAVAGNDVSPAESALALKSAFAAEVVEPTAEKPAAEMGASGDGGIPDFLKRLPHAEAASATGGDNVVSAKAPDPKAVEPTAITKFMAEAKPNARLTQAVKAAVNANRIPEFSALLDQLGVELSDVVVCARRATQH
jgi:hypothetical protein